ERLGGARGAAARELELAQHLPRERSVLDRRVDVRELAQGLPRVVERARIGVARVAERGPRALEVEGEPERRAGPELRLCVSVRARVPDLGREGSREVVEARAIALGPRDELERRAQLV